MAERYFAAKGNVYRINVHNLPTRYELQLPNDAKSPPQAETSPSSGGNWGCIMTGYNLKEEEITAKTACIDDKRVMYSFGKGFGDITVNFEALLGANPKECDFEQYITSTYDACRLSAAKGKTAKLSVIGGGTIEFHITGLQIGGYIAEFEVLPFSFVGVLAT